MSNFVLNIDMSKNKTSCLKDILSSEWGNYSLYNIFNLKKCDYKNFYLNIANSIGKIRMCHSVNDSSSRFSNSRDIKYIPDTNHYFSSNTRQPLHNDYAYLQLSDAPEWLMLYCMKPSDYGGITSVLSTETLIFIMKKYRPELFKKLHVDIIWKYKGIDGEKIHTKPLLNKNIINWNYFQVDKKLNSLKVIKIVDEFFNFLEDFISAGNIYDFSKVWKEGDCIIFNDKTNLHCRSAFLGDRWIKDHAIFSKKLNI